MYYALLKKLLFRLDPETAHSITLNGLKFSNFVRLTKECVPTISAPRELMGLTFLNPVGVAAGLDKNGDYIDALAALGFGFIEVGTITVKPQIGNPKPRLFRLVEQQALINRMGFNNKGVDYLVERLKVMKYRGVLGINIGKNKDTPLENAIDDYLYLYRRVHSYASYVTVNISSPNTENLRLLQHGEMLQKLLRTLKKEQALQMELQKDYVPLVVKLAPDLIQPEIEAIADILLTEKIDGVIVSNTTLKREGVETSPFANEAGGLSGKSLKEHSTDILRRIAKVLRGKIPIIASGGIFSAEDAKEKIDAGASLVQLYTGLIYKGPGLIEECVNALNPSRDR